MKKGPSYAEALMPRPYVPWECESDEYDRYDAMCAAYDEQAFGRLALESDALDHSLSGNPYAL